MGRSTPEGVVVKAICQYLELQEKLGHCVFYRVRNMSYNARVGGFLSAKGPGQKNGTPDIVCITKPDGHYVGIEVKSKVGRLSDSQNDFKRAVESVGGTFVLARSVDDVASLFPER